MREETEVETATEEVVQKVETGGDQETEVIISEETEVPKNTAAVSVINMIHIKDDQGIVRMTGPLTEIDRQNVTEKEEILAIGVDHQVVQKGKEAIVPKKRHHTAQKVNRVP